jgi:YNFM family putative membrane transporter
MDSRNGARAQAEGEALQAPRWTVRGSTAYRRVSLALFAAGFATFSLLYCVQPLLPAFARDFRVGPAEASLGLSLTTGFLALAILLAGAVSESVGRRALMFASICAAAVFGVAAALAPDWPLLLIARALEGVALGGVPAVAMAYLGEEIDPKGLGRAMGLFVAGNAFGGMAGRVGVGILASLTSWRVALAALGVLDLAIGVAFLALLPPSRNFVRRRGLGVGFHLTAWGRCLANPAVMLLCLVGFLVMGTFVTVYNYAGFRLQGPPYRLTQGQASAIFVVYLFGMAASAIAGALADRLGRGPVLIVGALVALLGLALTLAAPLAAVTVGIIVLTVGFFIAHSVASGWVGPMAGADKAHAASLYLLAYYLGSSLMGSAGGWFWAGYGWAGVAAFCGAMLAVAFLAAVRLQRAAG